MPIPIFDRAWYEAQVATLKAQIVALQQVATQIMAGGIQSYQLDTGQTRTLVTRINVSALFDEIRKLQNELQTLDAYLNGASFHMIPGF
jgi:hypothetical protein